MLRSPIGLDVVPESSSAHLLCQLNSTVPSSGESCRYQTYELLNELAEWRIFLCMQLRMESALLACEGKYEPEEHVDLNSEWLGVFHSFD